ncbi:hypothetical protein [Sporosarcina sp. Te-1]|uniref:hypothetical protein n=1 Tax=Sporosarcina sp. Te-1 TaxID=2818390 RepID=UPI001A9FBF79|nr:hypothetical protein [Sporosarcina sp. Te-1]QTD41830.1 hypothetical protein J3U78_02965 [Sporosarcina sp. Te-1]
MKRHFIVSLLALILMLSACSSGKDTATNELEGIELELIIDKQVITQNDEFIAKVIVTNHNDSPKEIYVPTPQDVEEGISAVMVEKKDKMQWQLLNPQNNQDILNIQGRSYYDYVLVKLDTNETIEQDFLWNKELIDQKSNEVVKAKSGDYIVSTFVILDELTTQEEYYEPEKQVISKLTFVLN